MTQEKITDNPEEKPITENSRRTLSLRTFMKTVLFRNLKRTLSL